MSHDHDHHDHGHDQGPESKPKPALGDIDLPLRPKRTEAAPKGPARPRVIEDAGTQALADALKSSFGFVKAIFALLVAGLILSCFRQVHPHEVAVVLRFGKAVGSGKEQIRQPGMVFVLPYPIDELVRIPLSGTHTIQSTAGWYGLSAEAQLRGEDTPVEAQTLRPLADGYAITGDGNIMHVRATVNYSVEDPAQYTFHFANVTNLLQNIVNNAILHTAARFTSADALYENKIAFQEAVRVRIQHKTNVENNFGIKLSLVTVDTKVPAAVQQAFNSVQTAVENRKQAVTEAQSTATETLNKASGESQMILNRGLTRSNQVVQAVAAESRAFLDQLPYYQRDPRLFEDRLLAQTMERVFINAQDKFLVPTRHDGQSRELRLQLNKEPEAPKRKVYQ